MNNESEIDKLLLDLNPYCCACKQCQTRFDITLCEKLKYRLYCPKCLYAFLTNTSYLHQAVIQNGGIEFLEKLYFHQYSIRFVTIKCTSITDRVRYSIELTPKE